MSLLREGLATLQLNSVSANVSISVPSRRCCRQPCLPLVSGKRSGLVHWRAARRSYCAATSSLPSSGDDTIAFCLDSAVADLSHLTVTIAYAAAQNLWPDHVVGPVRLYVDTARPILPALLEPHHAVVLVRLLCDEGVIGARSTAGREGPVVGCAPRHRGSRPLLVAEIAEHWSVVMASCLMRWSLEGSTGGGGDGRGDGRSVGGCKVALPRGGRDELLARTAAAYRAAQASLLADEGAVATCLEGIRPHTTAIEALRGSRHSRLLLTTTLPTDLGQRVLARCGLAPSPYPLSPYPAEHPPGLELLSGSSWRSLVGAVLGQAAADRGRVQMVTGNFARLQQLADGRNALGLEKLAEEAEGEGESAESVGAEGREGQGVSGRQGRECRKGGAAAGRQVAVQAAVVTSTNTAAAMVPERQADNPHHPDWRTDSETDSPGTKYATHCGGSSSSTDCGGGITTAKPAAMNDASSSSQSAGSAPSPRPAAASKTQGVRKRSEERCDVLRTVHLAEWACSSMSFRARALSYTPRASLLSEHHLAEALGVTHLDVVMDGIAWRR